MSRYKPKNKPDLRTLSLYTRLSDAEDSNARDGTPLPPRAELALRASWRATWHEGRRRYLARKIDAVIDAVDDGFVARLGGALLGTYVSLTVAANAVESVLHSQSPS